MPVEDPKALAQAYLGKHNIEKIFEASPPLVASLLRVASVLLLTRRFSATEHAGAHSDPAAR